MSTPPGPTVLSNQVTPDTQRLLDELINTPPAVTSVSPSVTIPVSVSNVSPPRSSRITRSTSNFRKEQDDNAHMVSTLVDLKYRVLFLENFVGDILKMNDGESSCRQNVIIPDSDDEDTKGAQGNKGDGQQVNENVGEHVDKETLDCRIDLDDWESDAEDVEIEFEQYDEVAKYATHEGVEFDTSIIDQINNLA
ncbi:hypothetical protein L1987_15159 [Smallanthus sonchifolius]|uniref:Uncharacterized protein n=1 Tax=Smallanthus sonchifolius TaxID=185202 RepID=A0ACB9J5A8_9ASTR|nr:hypothetical protein L1987_15159 [Smallanthus sonchifolius]